VVRNLRRIAPSAAGTEFAARRWSAHPHPEIALSILQLKPPIPVVTPKGDGYAHVLIDYGAEFNLLWVVFLDDSGECWTYDNSQVRAQKNVTMGRTFVSMHKTAPPAPKDEPVVR
jgi:hypothetical protein